jgi:hypothetical protein
MGRPLGTAAGPQDRSAAARTTPPEARSLSHSAGGLPQASAFGHLPVAGSCPPRRNRDRRPLPTDPITCTANWVCAASWVSWPWPRSSASRPWRTPAPRRGISAFHEYRFVRRPQAPLSLDPLIRELVHCRDLIQQRLKEQEQQGSLFETPGGSSIVRFPAGIALNRQSHRPPRIRAAESPRPEKVA